MSNWMNRSAKMKKRITEVFRRIRMTASSTVLFPNAPVHLVLVLARAPTPVYCPRFLLFAAKPATAQPHLRRSSCHQEGPFVGRTGSLDLDARSVSVAMSRYCLFLICVSPIGTSC